MGFERATPFAEVQEAEPPGVSPVLSPYATGASCMNRICASHSAR